VGRLLVDYWSLGERVPSAKSVLLRAQDLSAAVAELAARYHDDTVPGGRRHRLVVALHPSITQRKERT